MSRDFTIVTDSSCDLSKSMIDELGITLMQLDVVIENEGVFNNDSLDVKDFYSQLRGGKNIKTSAVNSDLATTTFEKILKEGKDILYIGFSSGLSSTYQTAHMVAEELKETYPDRKIITVDTLAASMGQGLLVYKACGMKKAGKDIDSIAAYIEDIKLKLTHLFTVDDLFFLKRGGRVSGVTATVGTMLNIKPILHVDDEGHLINIGKVRGRKVSISDLAKRMEELAIDPGKQDVFISHGDCLEDAEKLADIIRSKFGTENIVINYVGPVIGAHSGPGTLALFFVGKNR